MDYKGKFNPRDYLREYYSKLGAENMALLRFMHERFSENNVGGKMLDIASGPTIYQLISAAAHVEEIHASDILKENLLEISSWLTQSPDAFDWTEYIRAVLSWEFGEHPSKTQIAIREMEIRQRVKRLLLCDARQRPPIRGYGKYDVLVANFCAESIAETKDEFERYFMNICTLLKPGGLLVTALIRHAEMYRVGDVDFPSVPVDIEDVQKVLVSNGFGEKTIKYAYVNNDDDAARLYDGLLFVSARKK